MKTILFLLLIIITPVMWAQESQLPDAVVYSSLLQPGELLSIGNRSIKFREVVMDSRCPKEVMCVWAGEAKVLVELFENNILIGERILTVNTGNIPLDFSAGGVSYNLNRILLSPYPSTKVEEPNYELEISITERIL
ncbi:hypothetical protein FHG64_08760 [Antarcticibacterium flavum]|uniref:Uncharacterized protein n=1 Tax=Antarcticibacterium flavum TaxID=2058175 RepID=A0A5B7X403_9FLAO|nr:MULTISPECIES: hypothetical protein [Antarcticibacterium]MCM4159069.1 hypothetical protein [Antarcticibacterium sp. W02-3]QCY69472.1 hypothetical protein FHG64_08760 [Antarcticibacterium flavum]